MRLCGQHLRMKTCVINDDLFGSVALGVGDGPRLLVQVSRTTVIKRMKI